MKRSQELALKNQTVMKGSKESALRIQTGMKRSQESALRNSSYHKIPFVAGKSLSKSHNLGIAIQETKSLLKIQVTKKNKPKTQIRSKQQFEYDNYIRKFIFTTFPHNFKKQAETEHTCPVLKHKSDVDYRQHIEEEDSYGDVSYYIDSEDDDDEKENLNENQTVEEIWANYMYEIESKNIIPLKCTCFPGKSKKKGHKQSKRNVEELKNEAVPSTNGLFMEAQKMVDKCFKKQQMGGGIDINSDYTFTKNLIENKPSKSKELAQCMQQIKRIQEKLFNQTTI